MKDRAFSVGTTSIAYRPAIEAVPTRHTPSLVADQIIDDTLAYFIQQGVLFDVILDNVENRSLAGIGSILKPERGGPLRRAQCSSSSLLRKWSSHGCLLVSPPALLVPILARSLDPCGVAPKRLFKADSSG